MYMCRINFGLHHIINSYFIKIWHVNLGTTNAVSALPFTTEFQIKPAVERDYSWMGDHLGIASCSFSKSFEFMHVSRVGLSRALRVFLRILRFPSLRKINI